MEYSAVLVYSRPVTGFFALVKGVNINRKSAEIRFQIISGNFNF